MIIPQTDVLKPDNAAPGADEEKRSRSESCAKIKSLGFTASKHIRMYGEQCEIVSEPFSEGDCVAVHAICGKDPKVRTLRLPTAMLVNRNVKRRMKNDND